VDRFGRHVRTADGARRCDLVAAAVEQLTGCGVPPERILDSGVCTACDTSRWFSLRREGPSTGRLASFITVKP
jgi:copper oxidase (laccase) domain-containing protein